MEQRLVRDELAKCYKSEGVNHYVNCKHLSERKDDAEDSRLQPSLRFIHTSIDNLGYFAMLKEHKHVTGYA